MVFVSDKRLYESVAALYNHLKWTDNSDVYCNSKWFCGQDIKKDGPPHRTVLREKTVNTKNFSPP